MTEQELVAAILDDPDAEGPRRAYAAWLRRQGDPLGAYIELHLEASALPIGDARNAELQRRLDELGVRRAWFDAFGAHRMDEGGLAAQVTLRASLLDSELPRKLRGALVRRSILEGARPSPAQLAVLASVLPAMRLRQLWIHSSLEPAALASILASTGVARLERLMLYAFDDGAARVIAGATLPELATLVVWGPVGLPKPYCCADDGAIALSRGGVLRELVLREQNIGAPGAAALVAGALPLVSLDLTGNPLGERGVAALLAGARTRALEDLTLVRADLDLAAVRAIAAAPELARLRRLALGTLPSREAIDVLVASPHLPRDMTLVLGGEHLGLDKRYAMDGASGFETHDGWSGPLPPPLADRFRVEIVL